jgi:RNA-directed DNA polymerase
MYGWNEIDWRKLDRQVFKLQKRIFQASTRGDVKLVRRLQKLLISSWSTRALAVQGKCTYCNNYFKDGDILETDHISPVNKIKLSP